MKISLKSVTEWDTGVFLAAGLLVLLGGMAMMSASAAVNPQLAVRHGAWIMIGLLACAGVASTDYRRWTDLAGLAYGLTLCLLVLVPVAGAMRLGATRWLSILGFSVQPSEIMKLTTICLLARYLGGQPGGGLTGRALGISLGLAGVPAVLVFLQPDLGSASVFGAIWLGMVWVAGISRRALRGFAGSLLVLLPMGWHLLKDYQRDRLMVFLNPHTDPLGAGYTIIQSKIAIGSGVLFGRGWFAGTQNQLSFLPERHSDFIFSVIGEEWGFLGAVAVVALFGLLLTRAIAIARSSPALEGRLLSIGVVAWLGFQAFVNMGMVMGLLPVVGVPLPLISYGGTSMVTVWLALGLLQSVHRSP